MGNTKEKSPLDDQSLANGWDGPNDKFMPSNCNFKQIKRTIF